MGFGEIRRYVQNENNGFLHNSFISFIDLFMSHPVDIYFLLSYSLFAYLFVLFVGMGVICCNIHHQVKPHDIMTSSNGNIFRITGPLCGEYTGPGEFPTQRPVTRSFDVFFDLCLNKRLSKQPWGWWFETPSWSLWRQCNDMIVFACRKYMYIVVLKKLLECNLAPSDPFMSHLHVATQIGYSAGEFQALQLVVLAAFCVVD